MLARFSVFLQMLLASVVSWFEARQAVRRMEGVRAAGLLEYALVALLSIGVFWLISQLFKDTISSLFERIKQGVNKDI